MHTRERRSVRNVLAALMLIAGVMPRGRADAQVIGAEFVYVPAGQQRIRPSIGIQGDFGFIFTAWQLSLWPSIALEYQRQTEQGPGRGRLAFELRAMPGVGERRIHPYLGGSISANQSGGQQSQWPGTVFGLQGMLGVLFVPSDHVPVAVLLEERYGYVQTRDHSTATHLGLMFSFR